MRKKMEFKWEEIDVQNEGKFVTMRAKVIGGWLIQTIVSGNEVKSSFDFYHFHARL